MKMHAYFLCYNEERILPFLLDYYGKFCEKITIYDNQSTDRSRDIILQYPNTTIVDYDGHGVDDVLHSQIKNECWKGSRGKCDFVVVADIDEFLYADDLQGKMTELQAAGMTVVRPVGFDMVSETYPEVGVPITEAICKGLFNKDLCKCIAFDPNAITEINYGYGAHDCRPEGNVKIYNSTGDVKILHYKFLELEHYFARMMETQVRVNKENVAKGIGVQFPPDHYVATFKRILRDATDILPQRGK